MRQRAKYKATGLFNDIWNEIIEKEIISEQYRKQFANIFEEIKNRVSPIRDTIKTPDTNSNNIDYSGVADDVLNED